MGISTIIIHIFLFTSLYFEVFLLITYFERRADMKKEEETNNLADYPKVSIFVPCFNEEKSIAKTIESILALEYPKEKLEVLVVDDGSTDNTFAVAKKFEINNYIKVFRKENGGKYTALNFALSKATGEFVGCLDADSFAEKSALKNIIAYFRNDRDAMAVIPSIKVHAPINIVQMMQKVEYAWGIFLRKMFSYMGALYVTPGPFSIFRKKVFDDLGPYRHAYNTEDMELAMRMQANNYKIINCHKAHIYTITPHNIKHLYRQRVRWTSGFLKNALDYKFLFFNKKHGNLGLFILPIATLSILSAVYLATSYVWRIGTFFWDGIVHLQTVGFIINFHNLHLADWFFWNTGSTIFLTAVLFSITGTLVMLGRKMADGTVSLSPDILYFFALYGLVAPVWLAKSLWNVVLGRNASWK